MSHWIFFFFSMKWKPTQANRNEDLDWKINYCLKRRVLRTRYRNTSMEAKYKNRFATILRINRMQQYSFPSLKPCMESKKLLLPSWKHSGNGSLNFMQPVSVAGRTRENVKSFCFAEKTGNVEYFARDLRSNLFIVLKKKTAQNNFRSLHRTASFVIVR